jgi:hypothetical protein
VISLVVVVGSKRSLRVKSWRKWLAITLTLFSASPAIAGEREAFLLCVTDELGRGTDLSEIGGNCLEDIRPDHEPHEEAVEAEEYPYEATLRKALAIDGSLRDAEAARLQDLVYGRTHNAWCGRINAPNGFGGYVGWEYFALRDRYRGRGQRRDKIDFTIGNKELVAGTCKTYQAWKRELW